MLPLPLRVMVRPGRQNMIRFLVLVCRTNLSVTVWTQGDKKGSPIFFLSQIPPPDANSYTGSTNSVTHGSMSEYLLITSSGGE